MKKLIWLLLFLPLAAFGQGARYENHPSMKSRADGALVAASATIAVCTQPANTGITPCSPLATLYTDATLATPCTGTAKDGSVAGATNCSNPLVTDSKGNYHFYAAPNVYTLQVSGSGIVTSFEPDIAIAGSLAPTVAGVQYAATFASSSTTCGIQEAYNALPSTGGEIILQQGNCSASGWPVTIQKPILITGHGMGGTTDAGFNSVVTAGSSLTNTSTGNTFFVISLGATTSVEGTTLRDFNMIGNKTIGGATAGDCVDINGGTTAQQVRAIRLDNIQCNQPKGSGVVIKDNAFMVTLTNVHIVQSGSHCFVLKDGVNSGINSQIHVIASTFDLCGGTNGSFNPGSADAVNISGSTSRTIDIISSTMADSNNGINVVAGATNSNVHVTNDDFETNTVCDINLNDGFGHKIIGSTIFGTGVGARGICTAMPVGAAAQLNQLLLDANWFSGHTVQDITIGANQKTGFILPQNTNNYTYSDASGKVVRMDVNNGGALLFTGVEFAPNTNGSIFLGDSALAWGTAYSFSYRIKESAPASGAGAEGVLFEDSGDHMAKYNPNNGGEQHIPQIYILTAQYTNSTTGFTTVGTPNIAFPVNASKNYTATCHLFYQAAATGGLNIQFTGPAAPTAVSYGINEPLSATAWNNQVATAFSTSLGAVVTTATTNFDAIISFALVNGANAGTVTLQAKSSAAVQLQIQQGSFCRVQ